MGLPTKCVECGEPGLRICAECFRKIQRHAEHVARTALDPAPGDPDEITAAWLLEKHPESFRNLEEAEVYRQFCAAHTITWKGCYGSGSIMWPKWMELQRAIEAL